MGLEPAEPARRPRLAVAADRIFDGYRWHNDAVILIDRGVVQGIAPRGQSMDDWPTEVMPPGTVLAPGFIDLQVNGGGGILLNDEPTPDAMRAIARAHRRYGTTSCLPTLISDTRAKATAAIAAAKLLAGTDGILGLHLEGPFISRLRPGIHRDDRIRSATSDDLDWLGELSALGSSMVTLAPECVPAGFVKTLASSGIRVSVGHSEAAADSLTRAMLLRFFAEKAARTTSGSTWIPSRMMPAVRRSSVRATPTIPGSLALMAGIALKRCVTPLSPSSIALVKLSAAASL